MRVAFALTLALAAASAGCSSLLGIDDLRLGDDAPPGSDGGDAPGVNCIGGGLLWVCPDPAPTSELAVVGPQTIDTGTDPACVTMRSGTVEVCAIVRGSIDIATAATLRVIGPRPLVLASMSTISVLGVIDVSSVLGKPAGAGANPNACLPIVPPGSSAGGNGGSFGGAGGDGGNGGATSPPPVAVTEIRGGCPGGLGGGNLQPAGAGGGAVYLVARDGIVVDGRINASGAGGSGNTNTNSAGGAGGGAGGLIGLDAPAISGSGTMFANGGGGGGGGGLFGEGKPGTESPDAKSPGLGGASSFGADGGNGSVGTTLDGASGLDSPGGAGGGGGGGAGAIYARGMFTVAGAVSPPAKLVTP